MRIALLAVSAGIAALLVGVVFAGTSPAIQAQENSNDKKVKEEQDQQVAMQVDIGVEFAPFGEPGFFKLLADFTDLAVDDAHVAISNVQCDEEGTSPFALVVANANVGPGNTLLVTVPLNSSNLIDDVSFPGTACTYHVDISEDDYEFPVTDIALANGNNTDPFTPLPTSSATIRAEIAEQEDAVEQVLGENSEVRLKGTGNLKVKVKEGDLADGTYNVTFACSSPEIDEEFEDALTVSEEQGEFEQELNLDDGTYQGCEVTAGDLTAELPEFAVPIGEDDSDEDEDEDEDEE